MAKTRLISPIAAAFIKLAINILDGALTRHIPVEEVKEGVKMLLEPIKESITVLSDANPDNGKQIEQLWLEFVRSDKFNETAEKRILQAIDLIEDEQAKDFIVRIIRPCLATIRCLYDSNPNNVDQIRDIWIEFMTEKQNIKSGLSFFIKDVELVDPIAEMIDSIHDNMATIILEATSKDDV